MTRKAPRLLLVAAALILAAIGSCSLYLLVAFPQSPGPSAGRCAAVDVRDGIGRKGLARLLFDAGLTARPLAFSVWLWADGGLARVKAGAFDLCDDLTPRQIMDRLSAGGRPRGARITIPEGFTLRRIGGALAAAGVARAEDFLAAAADPGLLASLGLLGPTAEGFLFPDTYFFMPGARPEDIVRTMHGDFRARIRALGPDPGGRLREVVILASIVQAETGLTSEMPIIAGVLANRLASLEFPSRLLQADPTVSYGCEPVVTPRAPSCASFRGVLGRSQLDDAKNPYNTYRHPGLPPGPIGAPGLDALAAALAPARVPYFYYVAKGDGGHAFSATLAEHERAVARYREGR